MSDSTYKFYGISNSLPSRKSGTVNRDELIKSIQSNPFTSIDNIRSFNKWMKDTMYLGSTLTRVS